MAGSLQQNVRALMVRASSPMPSSERHKDEVARLRAQLHHSMRTNHDMRGLLQNQALSIEQLQSRWQMAGQEAHAFVAQTRSESEDFVRTELGAIERFEDRMQRQYDGELQKHVHALQDECREHVGQEESKLRSELTHALTHESQVCKDQEVLSHQEVPQLRSLVAAQQEELRSIHHDCAELQRKSATTEAELQRKSAHEEHALYQHFDNAIKEKDAQVHALQHEISRTQEKKQTQLEAELFDAERVTASAQAFAEGPSTVRFATPVEKVATAPLTTRLDTDAFQRQMDKEDLLSHPDFLCVTIQEAPQGTLAMMVEEEVDLMSLMMARLLIRTRIGAHHGSQLEIQIRMVIMIAMHVCTSP